MLYKGNLPRPGGADQREPHITQQNWLGICAGWRVLAPSQLLAEKMVPRLWPSLLYNKGQTEVGMGVWRCGKGPGRLAPTLGSPLSLHYPVVACITPSTITCLSVGFPRHMPPPGARAGVKCSSHPQGLGQKLAHGRLAGNVPLTKTDM